MLKKKMKYSAGFTIIEMLVVTALTAMIVVSGISLFLTTIVGGGRANTSTIVKTNGDYALGQIEFLLRNAITLVPSDPLNPATACLPNMSEIRLKSTDQGVTRLFAENSKIASNSGIYLTSDAVELIGTPRFDCSRTGDNAITTVKVTFTLKKGQEGVDRVSEIQEQIFETTVSLRGQ